MLGAFRPSTSQSRGVVDYTQAARRFAQRAQEQGAVIRTGAEVRNLDGFLVRDDGRVINVLNAPSPAATSSLSIASMITDRLADRQETIAAS